MNTNARKPISKERFLDIFVAHKVQSSMRKSKRRQARAPRTSRRMLADTSASHAADDPFEKEPPLELCVGEMVKVVLPPCYRRKEYLVTVIAEGYRPRVWKVRQYEDKPAEWIHEDFLRKVEAA